MPILSSSPLGSNIGRTVGWGWLVWGGEHSWRLPHLARPLRAATSAIVHRRMQRTQQEQRTQRERIDPLGGRWTRKWCWLDADRWTSIPLCLMCLFLGILLPRRP